MKRPCTITHPVLVNDGKPFDAYVVREVPVNGMGICLATSPCEVTFIPVNSIEELEATRVSTTFQIAQALNPPIKVTQAVLDAMKDDSLDESYYFIVGEYSNQKIHVSYLRNIKPVHLLWKKIIADCPLALKVLLQFNSEGEILESRRKV